MPMKKLGIATATLLLLLAAAFAALTFTPQPMSSDLSQIGQGTPAVVLAYENYSPTGGQALARLKQIRPDYEPGVRFIVADLGTPHGRAFASRLDLSDGQAILLSGDGRAVTRLASSEMALREQLDRELTAIR